MSNVTPKLDIKTGTTELCKLLQLVPCNEMQREVVERLLAGILFVGYEYAGEYTPYVKSWMFRDDGGKVFRFSSGVVLIPEKHHIIRTIEGNRDTTKIGVGHLEWHFVPTHGGITRKFFEVPMRWTAAIIQKYMEFSFVRNRHIHVNQSK